MALELIEDAVPAAELEVGGTVTAHMRWPWEDHDTTETGVITAVRVEPNGAATVTVNGQEFLAFPPGEPGFVWFTDYLPPPLPELDLPPPPEDNPLGVANAAAAAAAPAEEEEDVLSSVEPSPMPSRDSPVGEEPAYEDPGKKSAPPTPARPPRRGGKRTRKARPAARKTNRRTRKGKHRNGTRK